MTHLVLPVLFELTSKRTEVLPGPGTAYTLKEAAKIARRYGALILFTAGDAVKGEYTGINMGRTCQAWFNRQWPDLKTAYTKAVSFNTIGEIEAMVRYVNQKQRITSVTVVVKSWHAPRTKLFVDRLQAAGRIRVPVRVIPHQYPWQIDIWNLGWRLREYVAYLYWYLKYDATADTPARN